MKQYEEHLTWVQNQKLKDNGLQEPREKVEDRSAGVSTTNEQEKLENQQLNNKDSSTVDSDRMMRSEISESSGADGDDNDDDNAVPPPPKKIRDHQSNGNMLDTFQGTINSFFTTLKEDIASKDNEIILLRNRLEISLNEKKALQEKFADEKEQLQKEIVGLQNNSKQTFCTECERPMNQSTFCSNDCLQ